MRIEVRIWGLFSSDYRLRDHLQEIHLVVFVPYSGLDEGFARFRLEGFWVRFDSCMENWVLVFWAC